MTRASTSLAVTSAASRSSLPDAAPGSMASTPLAEIVPVVRRPVGSWRSTLTPAGGGLRVPGGRSRGLRDALAERDHGLDERELRLRVRAEGHGLRREPDL